ncbi:hypothetical protein [Amphritea sp.]|uniref:hypothetical protein n=1 Tax=Amphritea sp. TaxID=1872502 RepID=UPI003A8DB425
MHGITPQIIGSGMIAQAFSESRFSRQTLVFASGVSNSSEARVREFQRERELLEKVVEENPDSEIIYFSSTSILMNKSNAYSEHKKNMEALLVNKAKDFYIFRLPQVVGVVLNNTLVSYLVRSCMERRCLDVHGNAVRNLIDIDDVVRIVQLVVNERLGACSIQTLASASNVPVPYLVTEISGLLNVPCEINTHPKGDDQTVSIDFLRKYLDDADPILDDDYWKAVLRKYVPLLKSRISGE